MTDREAMQMALEALNLPSMKTMQMLRQRDEAITALRAKLEQPEQEPVGWMYSEDYERMLDTETFCTVFSVKVGSHDKGDTDVPLYVAPPQRKPLTDEQIEELDDKVRQVTIDKGSPVGWFAMQLARAIEAAHGIGEIP